MTTNRKNHVFNRVGDFIDLVGSAVSFARAARNGRIPRDRDLQALGVDAELFRSLGKF